MSSLVKLYHGYSNLLVKYPVRTQAISTAIIMGSGDIIAQKLVEKRKWEPSRTIKFGAIGLFTIGPLLNFWYAFLDRIYKGQSVVRTVKMVATDQIVMAPILCSSIIGLAAFTRNWSVEEAKQKLSTSFCSALKKNYMVVALIGIGDDGLVAIILVSEAVNVLKQKYYAILTFHLLFSSRSGLQRSSLTLHSFQFTSGNHHLLLTSTL
ncbi:unnamed protein product [Hydatigera taeniaeformis]|uniref:Mitochondrial inner membrane protein Mpv17 n=1 Tax=Hydatigena taeniaeformis TaxID=6205 RepID=A0A0R3X5C9_HYDTA|nr:unnamed protein product [Hydatigera taeniaeformis]